MDYELVWVRGHIEVYDWAGRFCFSADNEREAREELGLSLSPDSLRFLLRQRTEWEDGTGLITDTFLARAQLPPQGVRPNPREVNDWKIVPFEAYYRAVMFNKDAEFGRALRRAEEEMNSL